MEMKGLIIGESAAEYLFYDSAPYLPMGKNGF